MNKALLASHSTTSVPRSIGATKVSSKSVGSGSGIDQFRTSGSAKLLFARRSDAVEGIMINTSGGLTGGDRFEVEASAGEASRLVLTTQAAERGYRSLSGTARVRSHLRVAKDAALHWLPQEFIMFDGSSVERNLIVDLVDTSELVLVEPVVFGRHAMGETLSNAAICDTITLSRNGASLYSDRINLSGAISEELKRPAIAAGMTAMASVFYHGPHAEVLLPSLRALLPATGGASMPTDGLICVRLLAEDSYLLRKSLVPLLELLTTSRLPKSWSL
ncbi:MAG: urease accessory protein UreD [Pseudomonadota bacterium]